MTDDYLWDGSGKPDPEILQLENTLAKFRHEGQAPEFPAVVPMRQPPIWQHFLPFHWSLGLRLAAGAGIILFTVAIGILRWSQKPMETPGPGWNVERLAGTPRVESGLFGRQAKSGKLGLGQTLVTDSH